MGCTGFSVRTEGDRFSRSISQGGTVQGSCDRWCHHLPHLDRTFRSGAYHRSLLITCLNGMGPHRVIGEKITQTGFADLASIDKPRDVIRRIGQIHRRSGSLFDSHHAHGRVSRNQLEAIGGRQEGKLEIALHIHHRLPSYRGSQRIGHLNGHGMCTLGQTTKIADGKVAVRNHPPINTPSDDVRSTRGYLQLSIQFGRRSEFGTIGWFGQGNGEGIMDNNRLGHGERISKDIDDHYLHRMGSRGQRRQFE